MLGAEENWVETYHEALGECLMLEAILIDRRDLADEMLGLDVKSKPVNVESFTRSREWIEGIFGQSIDDLINVLEAKRDALMAVEHERVKVHRAALRDRQEYSQAMEGFEAYIEQEREHAEHLHTQSEYQVSLAGSLQLKMELMLREREMTFYSEEVIRELMGRESKLLRKEQELDRLIEERTKALSDFQILGPEVAELAIRHKLLRDALQ